MDRQNNQFVLYTERRKGYVNCLSEVKEYLTSHSIAIKSNKLSNIKGITKILDALIENVDEFMGRGELIELVLTKDGKNVQGRKQ